MDLERLQLETDGPVARVWLNRPDVRNAFDGLMVTELRKTLFHLLSLDSVRGSLAIIEYAVRFMKNMELISEHLASAVETQRAELDDQLATLTVSLRGRLGEQSGRSRLDGDAGSHHVGERCAC